MKKNNLIRLFKYIFYLLLLCEGPLLWAQQDKTIQKEFSNTRNITIEHRNGPLLIKPSTDGKTHVRAMITVEASSKEEAQQVFDQFDLQVTDQAGTLYLKTLFDVVNSNRIGSVIRLTFKDGTKVQNLRNLNLSLEVQTPNLEELMITSKYHEIRMDDGVNITKSLQLHTYESNLQIGDIQGNLDIDAKYTKGAIGNFGNAKLVLYECNLQLGTGKQTEINTKYSKLVFGQLETLNLTSYEDEVTTGNINGDITIVDKYSQLRLGAFRNARMDIYESKLASPLAQDVLIKSKYTEIKIDQVDNVNFELSYEDHAEFGQIGNLSTGNSKYGHYFIGTLRYLLALNSYEDEVTVQNIQSTLKGISLEGKYLKLNAKLPEKLHYQLNAKMKYGKLEYPGGQESFDWLIYKEKGDDLEIKGKSKGATEQSPMILINTYEGKVSFY